ncbi:MAG: hypothetical protein JXR69_10505 [Candidatus Delongbacteria bacterium]|nr:hypothetical protein [Candidatus Delongbacteria bacterium]
MKMKRNITKLSNISDSKFDEEFVKGDMPTLFEMVWEITCDLWTFSGENNAEQPMRRDVVNIIRKKDILDVKMLKKLKR